MAFRGFGVAVGLVCASGCYVPPDARVEAPRGTHESSEIVFQAVDAGTGGVLSDAEMVVRHLVRTPITFDDTGIETVSSSAPYRIAYDIADPELEIEVRLEAASYHRLDTVLTVPRGGSAGPLTMRLSRRLELVGQGPAPEQRTEDPPPDPPDNTAPSGEDRTALDVGNRAFEVGDWLAAAEAFQRMPRPRDETSEYGRAYQSGKTRQGIAHINRSEYARALEVLEEASTIGSPGPDTFLRLAEAQCAVGRTEEGRGTLAQLSRARNRMPPTVQNLVTAMIEFQRGVCTHGEFERAETTRERVRSGSTAMRELEGFIQGADAMSPRPAEVDRAVEEARRLIEDIRRSVGGGAPQGRAVPLVATLARLSFLIARAA